MAADLSHRRRVVIVGGGFAGFHAARLLGRRVPAREAEVVLVSDTDSMLYQPLLPGVAAGTIDPRTVAVPLASSLPGVRLRRGRADAVDPGARTVTLETPGGHQDEVGYDILLLAPGAVTRLLDIPGLAEHAIGFKTNAEALFLRDHVLGRMEAAAELDEPERSAALTFLVVGAGYAGTELTAQMARVSDALRPSFPGLGTSPIRWLLLDTASSVMPELGADLGRDALALLQRRGVDVRLKTSVTEVRSDGVTLTDGTRLPCRTVVWCAGVTGNPLLSRLQLRMTKGRLAVNPNLTVPGHPGMYAFGDAAAVPDLTQEADEHGTFPLCAPTAQHATRQGAAAARNVLADLRGEPRADYRHRDLGLVVDLGGLNAVARPLGRSVRGPLAKVVTSGYHWYALPTGKRRARLLSDWLLAGRRPDDVSLGLVQRDEAVASRAEHELS